MVAGDESFARADRALALLRKSCVVATPNAFELCFALAGKPDSRLTEAVDASLALGARLSVGEVNELHARFLRGPDRLAERTEETAAGLLQQVDAVKASVAAAQGSAQRYGASLAALAGDMAEPGASSDLRSVLDSLASATRDMAAANRTMQRQMAESRDEVDRLRVSLDDARRETMLDALTGIANRRHFETSLAAAAVEASRDGRPLSLIFIDIDHFKHFNDTFGHATGDQVLRLVSATMREQVRSTDTLARFGGEEFAVVLPGCALEAALVRADAIRTSVISRELVKRSTGETLGRVTVSAGVATLRAGESPLSLIERADAGLYRAKREGRNRVATEGDPASLPDAA